MIKQNGHLENLLVFPKLIQSRLSPIQIHGQSELDWVRVFFFSFFWKKHKVFKCVGVREGCLGWGCVRVSTCRYVNEV